MCHSIDLHLHSHYSDEGTYSPSELTKMCYEHGINLFALTDHNTVKGVEEAIGCADRYGKKRFPAIEIDCVHLGLNFQVLGYQIEYRSTDFEAIEQNIRRQTAAASKERLRLVNKLGFSIHEDEVRVLAENSFWPESWTGEIIAEVLLSNEAHHQNPLLFPYITGNRSDNPFVNFYWDYCSRGKACYVSITYPEMSDIIQLIHDNAGEAVLAHPGVNLKGRWEFIDKIMPLGLDGVEAYSSYHDNLTANWFARKACKNGLYITQGSDFHGKTKPSAPLGCGKRKTPCAITG